MLNCVAYIIIFLFFSPSRLFFDFLFVCVSVCLCRAIITSRNVYPEPKCSISKLCVRVTPLLVACSLVLISSKDCLVLSHTHLEDGATPKPKPLVNPTSFPSLIRRCRRVACILSLTPMTHHFLVLPD